MKIQHKRAQKVHKLELTNHLACKEGITLIEIIISLAIFSIIMMLFSTLMGVAIQMRKNIFQQNRNSMALMKNLALDDPTLIRENEEIVIQFENGKTLKIQGQIRSKEEKDVRYKVFVPNE